MKKFILYGFVLPLIIILSGCGKYEEGPTISFKSRQKRIEGLWKVEKFMAGPVDSTNFYKSLFGEKIDITDGRWEMPESGGTIRLKGDWNWHTLKYYTVFEMDSAIYINGILYPDTLISGIGPFNSESEIKWEIVRIASKELILSTQIYNLLYRMELSLEKDH